VAHRRRRWRVRLSEPAEHDYVAILQWTAARFGRGQASVYRETLIGALIALADDLTVPDGRPREEIQPGLRLLHVARQGRRGRHLILYRTTAPRTIDIVRILHDLMDVGRHVPDDPTPGES
jgi:toxin ParE1/3/4